MRKNLFYLILHHLFYLTQSHSLPKPLILRDLKFVLKIEGIDLLVVGIIFIGIIALVIIGSLAFKYLFKRTDQNDLQEKKGDNKSIACKDEKNKEEEYNISEMIQKDIENYKKELHEERERKTNLVTNNLSVSDVKELINVDITSNNNRETKINSYCDTPSTRENNHYNNITYKIDLESPVYNFSLKPKATIETVIDPTTAIQLKEIKLKKVFDNFKQKIDLVVIDEVEEDKNDIIRTKTKKIKHTVSKGKDNSDSSSVNSSTLNQLKKERTVNFSNTYRSEPNESFYDNHNDSNGHFEKNINFNQNFQSEGNNIFCYVNKELNAK